MKSAREPPNYSWNARTRVRERGVINPCANELLLLLLRLFYLGRSSSAAPEIFKRRTAADGCAKIYLVFSLESRELTNKRAAISTVTVHSSGGAKKLESLEALVLVHRLRLRRVALFSPSLLGLHRRRRERTRKKRRSLPDANAVLFKKDV
ncbi:unnamed protein product [Trichogramma brassicae]|uniref:Uncharacterized protein n=1 Tax=Trichogramma brassicae TaxID=86971 RepID=A0A6H5IXJ7_9HYME|nr:unnamed protein product [Trichogramma brassicae]